MQMKQLLKEWKQYINENHNDLFEKNIDTLNQHYTYIPEIIAELTPENSKILTQIEIGEQIGHGGFGQVFSIVGSNLVIKFFLEGIEWEVDLHRMKKISDEIFSGKASMGKMHYFEAGDCGDSLHYVVMPRIIPFERSITYEQDRSLFNDVSSALSETANGFFKTYADFRDEFYKQMSLIIKDEIRYNKDDKDFANKYLERMNALDDTIHKILRITYKTMKEEGGIDLHLGNMGFFPQKPDDWFFFDIL